MFKKMIVAAAILGTLLGFGGGMETASATSRLPPPGHHQHFNHGCVRPARITYEPKSPQISKYNPERPRWRCGRDRRLISNYKPVPRPGSHRGLHR